MNTVALVAFGKHETGNLQVGWLGLGYITSALKKLNNVRVNVAYYDASEIDKATADIVEMAPMIVGLPIYQNNFEVATEFIKKVKSCLPQLHITVGGVEATTSPMEILENIREIDSLVIGEGEYTVCELVKREINGESLKDCKGLFYRENGLIRKNENRALEEDLDKFEFPERHLSANKSSDLFRTFLLATTRGCRGNCTFCCGSPHKYQPGPQVRFRSINNVLDEMEYLINEYKANYILFCDSSFEDGHDISGERYNQLYKGIVSRKMNVRFLLQSRAETIDDNSIKALSNLLCVGLDTVFVGIDAGNKEDLNLYGKRATINDNTRAIQLLNKHEIPFTIGLIMFNPYTTFERLYQNIKFLKETKAPVQYDVVSNRLWLHSGLPIAKKIRRDGLLIKQKDTLFISMSEGWEYHFKDKRIEWAWQAINLIDGIPDTQKNMNETISFSNYLSFYKNPFRNHEKVSAFRGELQKYLKESAEWILAYITKVLEYAEKGENNLLLVLKPDYENLIKRLKLAWDIVKTRKIAATLLLRKESRPLKNYTY
ncbi:MAG: hypothetical protein QG657_3710 [Acidobacteriota bacterium]|nr:hypothetical protein [Acidobacteriota bacterium]